MLARPPGCAYRCSADAAGQPATARIYRSHDDYRDTGGNLEAGFVDRPWAKRLLLRAFLTDYDKEYQHNLVMTIPYGAVTYDNPAFAAALAPTRERVAGDIAASGRGVVSGFVTSPTFIA